MSAELRARFAVALVGVPVALLAIHAGGWYLGGLLAVLAGVAALEFQALARVAGGRPVGWLGIPAASMLVLLAAYEPTFGAWADRALALLLALVIAALVVAVSRRGTADAPLLSVTATVAGVLYTGGTLAFAVLLRHLPDSMAAGARDPLEGRLLVLYPLVVIWASDTAAYFAGKRFGRTRMAPRVSPGKTVEGGVAGLAAAVVVGALAGLVMRDLASFPVSPAIGALVGLALGVGGQLGDLAESLLKREAGVKDSGTLLPGHGGVLDRFDALFFSLPLAYVLLVLTQLTG
ncbi:MAG: CDP-archaeol synthase [Gemmatimonadetes bacterium]|nr:CDP-archaeol synthase [Gemmatimonadota bacterium]MCY3676990.1 CDP-archaeol synthase [Gemmatimonadota bacterium]MYA41689.1 CDP-archaeol synthase [Gemmatimonadota bacterium]MYE94957.1 CDP-archaeol synthase [Gemmatimonadota bacterium]MYJ11996.1 CDP-archaeol synthase [Gemmatimonadota bacterium]